MSVSGGLAAIKEALTSSAFQREIARVREGASDGSVLFAGEELRSLSPEEVAVLEENRNLCEEWEGVRVASGFDAGRVFDSRFLGRVVLGAFTGTAEPEPGVVLPSGVYRSVVSNCEIGNDALVSSVALLAHTIVNEGACLLNCGSVLCSGETTFGNGIELPLAIEAGGRGVGVYSEITVAAAAEIASSRDEREGITEYRDLVAEYHEASKSDRSVIGRKAVIANTSRVENVYLADHCAIRDAVMVRECTVLGSDEEPTEIGAGVIVTSSILQWGTRVDGGAFVERSVLTEHSRVGRHGKVTDSIIGPNSHVEAGEISCSLVGPFVGFHHQALLIAAFWPEGRGNVGYGANVGSNHTGKVADQEIWPGEGTFFGLGCNIKFPTDFSEAPYSLVATGVNALPQKVQFPFSLINTPGEALAEVSPAYNEIIPGWVLSDNFYALRRNEAKYQTRNKARRSHFDLRVFRPETMALVLLARTALRSVSEPKPFYTDLDIPGLGKNYLKEENRLKAIESYTLCLRYFALLGMKREAARLMADEGPVTSEALYEGEPSSPQWGQERTVLLAEGHGEDVAGDLKALLEILRQIAGSVQTSKEKDDRRGARIIPDYSSAHPVAQDDTVVKDAWAELEAMEEEVEGLIAALGD